MLIFPLAVMLSTLGVPAQEAPPRCEVIPLPDRKTSFRIDGVERLRWHFGETPPRPFFYPLRGPSGSALTRMGHPGAPNHDHHRSIWFAHADVDGHDFWSDQTKARIRQKRWLCYEDGAEAAAMAASLGWYDSDGKELVDQELVVEVRPGPDGGTFVELQATFRPRTGTVNFGKTNFGFLAVRVAKGISGHFGGGTITSSEGGRGEPAIFGKRARWMDYSGRVATSGPDGRRAVVEGITYFDHPSNPGHPSRWHVREDGWMGASVCRERALEATVDRPLRVRYLLYAHAGGVHAARATKLLEEFSSRPPFEVVRSRRKHRQYDLRRAAVKK